MKKERANKSFRDEYFKDVPKLKIIKEMEEDIPKLQKRKELRDYAKNKLKTDKPFMVRQYVLNETLDLLLNHQYTDRMIRQYLREEWGVKPFAASNFTRQARDYIEQAFEGTREKILKEQLLKLNELYNKALEKNRFQICLNILEHQNKLLFGDEKVGLQILNINGTNTTDDSGITINFLTDDKDTKKIEEVKDIEDVKVIEDN